MKQNLTKVTKTNGVGRKRARLEKQQLAFEIRKARPVREGVNPHTKRAFVVADLVSAGDDAELRLCKVAPTRVEAEKLKRKGQLILRADKIVDKIIKWRSIKNVRDRDISRLTNRLNGIRNSEEYLASTDTKEFDERVLRPIQDKISKLRSMHVFSTVTFDSAIQSLIEQSSNND